MSRVPVLLRKAVHVVRQAEALADVEKEARAHAFAEHSVEEIERIAIGVQVALGTYSQTDVGLLGSLPLQLNIRPM